MVEIRAKLNMSPRGMMVSVLLSVALVLLGACLIAFDDGGDCDAATSETFTEDAFEYKVVSSKGSTVGLVGHGDPPAQLDIPSTVTHLGRTYRVVSICEGAFEGCSGITSLTIPDEVKSIGPSAFKGCTGMTVITVPAHLDTVARDKNPAFEGCTSIGKVVFTAGDGKVLSTKTTNSRPGASAGISGPPSSARG